MAFIWQTIPDPDALLALSMEEIGLQLIDHIRSSDRQQLHPSSFDGVLFDSHPEKYPMKYRNRIIDALLEGWAWLISEALIVPTSGNSNGWCKLSRRGEEITGTDSFANYQQSRLLPREVLHPTIRDRVWLNVLRGDFDLAVFEAMKAVEIAVREASKIDALGVKLMRAAFHQDTGPLADMNLDPGEREARMHLFAGAIGSYKNPISHRHVPLTDAPEVIEQIMLANHLLRIVDARAAANSS